MFKKNLFIFIFFFVNLSIYSQTKSFRTLKLEFTITENYEKAEKSSISGEIEYNSDPFIFIYQINFPKKQTFEINPQGCFYTTETNKIDFTKGENLIYEYCHEVLNIIKTDFNIQKDYEPLFCEYKNEIISTKLIRVSDSQNWDNSYFIKTYTDSQNKILQIDFINSKEIITKKIYFYDYEFYKDFYYPTKAIIEFYKDDKISSTTTYEFSNILFNQEIQKNYDSKIIEIQIPQKKDKIKSKKKYSEIKIPEMEKYRTSFFQIATNFGFIFYKKFITDQDNSNCGFYPSCSQYMINAISKNGFWGLFQGIDRITRCTKEEHESNLYLRNEDGKQIDNVD